MKLKKSEVWKNVPNTICYVSNLGNIKTIKNGKEHFIKPYNSHTGYLTFNLYINGKQKTMAIHTLVAKMFIGDRPDGFVINHIDGNKHNNSMSNLEYVTYQENSIHAFENGLNKSGEEHTNSKLTDKQVIEIKLKSILGYSDKELSEQFKVARRTINRIVNNQSRKYDSSLLQPIVTNSLGDKTLKNKLKESEDYPEDRTPVVVFHQHNSSKDYVCLSLDDFFDLVEKKKVVGKRVFK